MRIYKTEVVYEIYTTCFDQSDYSICNNYDLIIYIPNVGTCGEVSIIISILFWSHEYISACYPLMLISCYHT